MDDSTLGTTHRQAASDLALEILEAEVEELRRRWFDGARVAPSIELERRQRLEAIIGPYREQLTERQLEREREAARGLKAMALAPTIGVCRALLAGERAPWNVLDYFAAEQFGLRRRGGDGRYSLDDFNDVRRPV